MISFITLWQRWQRLGLMIGGIAAIVIFSTAFLLLRPAHWPVVETIGVDKWEAHHPFSGSQTISQQFTVRSATLSQIAVLIVDLKHQASAAPITLTLFEEGQHEPLRTVTVDGQQVRDDYYLPFAFEPIAEAAGQIFTFTIAAPTATAEAPYAVRLTAADALPGGVRLKATGPWLTRDIAFRYDRETTTAYVVGQWITEHYQAVQLAIVVTTAVVVLVLLLPLAASGRRHLLTLLVVVVVLGGLCLQSRVFITLRGDPGGDAYYYYNAADEIRRGINPLSLNSYRVPMYSLFLVPGLSPAIPDFLWARLLGVAATIGSAVMLIILARQLRFHPLVGVVAWLWLLFNSHYLVTSVRPRPYQVFMFLLLTSLVVFFKVRTTWQALAWGVLLGSMAMTRQEAFLPAALLGLAFVITRWQRRWPWREIVRHTAAAAIPLCLMMAPYFYYNYQHYGHPLHNPYANRADTQNPHSFREFWHDNLVSTRDVLGSAWLPSFQTAMKKGSQPLLAATIGGLAVILFSLRLRWWRQWRDWWLTDVAMVVVTGLILTGFLDWLFGSGHNWAGKMNMVVVAAMIVGIVEVLRVGGWRGVLVLTVLLTQLGIAAWFQPNPKHFQQAFPFVALLIAAALLPLTGLSTTQLSPTNISHWRQSLRAAPLILLLAWQGSVAWRSLGVAIDVVNYPAAPYYTNMEAAERLQHYPGKVAAERDADRENVAYTFHSYLQHGFIAYPQRLPQSEELAWLCDEQPRYLVDHSAVPFFSVLEEERLRPHFQELFAVTASGRNDVVFRTTAYEIIDHERLCEKIPSQRLTSVTSR